MKVKDVRITFTTDENIRDRLKALAARKDVPVSQIIREALKLYFQEEDKK